MHGTCGLVTVDGERRADNCRSSPDVSRTKVLTLQAAGAGRTPSFGLIDHLLGLTHVPLRERTSLRLPVLAKKARRKECFLDFLPRLSEGKWFSGHLFL